MTPYWDELSVVDFDGDFDDQMHDQAIVSYRKGVDRVTEYIESIHVYPKLVAELNWAIEEGLI